MTPDNNLEIVQVTAIGLVSATFKLSWLFGHGLFCLFVVVYFVCSFLSYL